MKFVELAFKRLNEDAKTNDYIVWSEQLLEGGSEFSSVAELASCSFDANPDKDEVERLFQSCVEDMGLALPKDRDQALLDYSCSICEKFLHGDLAPWDCVMEMLELADDNNYPYVLYIWIDLVNSQNPANFAESENYQFNGVLDLAKGDECIRTTAIQFLSLGAKSLPTKFPWIWQCQECGAISEESTFTSVIACNCTSCGSTESMKNMRFFESRESFVANPSTQAIVGSRSQKPAHNQ